MKLIKIKIKGMHCKSCEVLLRDALQELQGASILEISYKTGLISIKFDESKTTQKKIIETIQKEGYEVE